MAGKKIGIILAADGEREFTQALSNAKKESALLNAELKNLNTEYKGNANSLEYLSKKQEILGKQTESFQKKVNGARQGLEHAQEVSQKAAKRYDELKEALEKAQKAQEELEKTGQSGSKEYQKQVKEVEDLQKALDKQGLECQKCEGKISDWSKKLVDAETDVKKNSQALEQNAKYLKEAENAADDCAKSIDGFGKSTTVTIETVKKFSQGLMEGLAGGIAEKGLDIAADAAAKAAEAIKDSMYDISSASSKLQASTGASATAMTKYNAVMKQIKGNNYGESYNDVAEAMGVVIQSMGELNDADLQNVTENAMALSDAFGYDYQEQLNAVNMLMKQFGISSDEAFNLIVQGTQQGLNKNGDLLDSINEYSVHYAQMGTTAEEFFNSLANGTEAGTFSVDKLGDAYKEFGIRVKDTATSTDEAYELLGLNADQMRTAFAEGGESAAHATDTVLDALMSMDDKVKQNQAGVDLFGTMWEDLGIEGVKALTNLEGEISTTKNAMEDLKEVRYSDLESAVSGLGSALQEEIITPIADKALPVVTGLFETATDVIEGIGEAISPQKTELESFVDEIEASNDEVQTLLDNAESALSGATADVGTLEAYKTTLMELNEQESLTEFQKYQLANAVSELSTQIPGLADAFDSATGSLSLTNEELAEMFDNAEALAMQNALVKAQEQSYEALAQATLNVAKADSAVEQALKKASEEAEVEITSVEQLTNLYDNFGSVSQKTRADVLSAVDAQEEAATAADAAQKQIEEENEAFADLREQYGLIPETAEEAADAIETTGQAADDAAQKFDEFGNNITGMTEEEAAAVTEASQKIVDAYENMRDGIASAVEGSISLFDEFSGGAETSASDMITNLDSQIDGITKWKENMETLAGELGDGMSQELYDKLAEMGPESANAVQALVDALDSETGEFEAVSQKWTEALKLQEDAAGLADYTSAGKEAAGQYVAGMLEGEGDSSEAGQQIAQAGAEAAQKEVAKFETAGTDSAANYAKAFQAAISQAAQAGGALASAARNAVAAYQNSFYNTGYNLSAGIASGMRAGQYGVNSAAQQVVREALAAAKAAGDIHSPSRKFRNEVGAQISAGMAFGISDKASLAGKAATKMSNKVYSNATSWLSKYKKKQQVSLEDEKWYWEQVVKHTKKGTTAYNNAIKNVKQITVTQNLTSSGLSSKTSSAAAKEIAKNFGVSKTTGSGKNKKTKDADTYYSEIYSAAQKYLSNQQILNDWSLEQELAYWKSVKSQLKKGTQAWYDATSEINSLQASITAAEEQAAKEALQTHVNVTNDLLSKYKVYYKVSAKAEMEYWNLARQQFKAGTDERIEADQKYLEACQDYYDQRKELDEDYAESSKQINDDLADSVKELQDTYHDAVASRKQDILSSMNLFESWDATGYDADTLLYNLKTQVAGLALWEQQLEELGKKGLSDDLMEELSAMGPDAAANIYSLNQMTAEQLAEYEKLWQQKNDLANSQAIKDNADLLTETNKEITNLRTEAQSELNALNADYRAALQELNTGISSELKNLVSNAANIGEDAVSGLISSIGKAATSVETYDSTTQVVDTISSQLSELKEQGKTIGANALDGLLAAMQDSTKINTASQQVIQSIKRAMEEAAEIHSPSRLFRRETGAQIPAGVALGMEDGTHQAVKSAQEMMQETLAAAQGELEKQQSALQEQTLNLSYAGIAKLNRLTEYPQQAAPIVNIDNSTLASLLGTLINTVNGLAEKMDNQQLVLDTGVVAAQMQPLISQESAAITVRQNRGRY